MQIKNCMNMLLHIYPGNNYSEPHWHLYVICPNLGIFEAAKFWSQILVSQEIGYECTTISMYTRQFTMSNKVWRWIMM